MHSIGHQLLVSFLKKQDLHEFYDAKLTEAYFLSTELPLFKYITDFADKHSVLPQYATVLSDLGDLPPLDSIEVSSYYLDKVQNRHGGLIYKSILPLAESLLKEKKVSQVTDLLAQAIDKVRISDSRAEIMDFAVDGLPMFTKSMNDKMLFIEGIKTGWDKLDSSTNGLKAGDILSIIGRPAQGKSFCALWACYHTYSEQNKTVLFISMEMGLDLINDRLVGIFSQSSLTEIQLGELSTVKKTQIFELMLDLMPRKNKFYVVNGNMKATIQDVASYISMLKPDLVVIDGAYLLKMPNSRENRFGKVADTVEALKGLAETAGVPMILSYQFNREATKQKKNEDIGMEHIGSSDSIPQVSSIVLGLMSDESAETMNYRVVRILKGRNGSKGTFMINWNFDKTNFSQFDPSDMETASLQYD